MVDMSAKVIVIAFHYQIIETDKEGKVKLYVP